MLRYVTLHFVVVYLSKLFQVRICYCRKLGCVRLSNYLLKKAYIQLDFQKSSRDIGITRRDKAWPGSVVLKGFYTGKSRALVLGSSL